MADGTQPHSVPVGNMTTVRCDYGDHQAIVATCRDMNGTGPPMLDMYLSCSPPEFSSNYTDRDCPDFESICGAQIAVCHNNSACSLAPNGAQTGGCDNTDTLEQCWNALNMTSSFGLMEFSHAYYCHQNCSGETLRYCYPPPFASMYHGNGSQIMQVSLGQMVTVHCNYGDHPYSLATCMDLGFPVPMLNMNMTCSPPE
eukprot:268077_1